MCIIWKIQSLRFKKKEQKIRIFQNSNQYDSGVSYAVKNIADRKIPDVELSKYFASRSIYTVEHHHCCTVHSYLYVPIIVSARVSRVTPVIISSSCMYVKLCVSFVYSRRVLFVFVCIINIFCDLLLHASRACAMPSYLPPNACPVSFARFPLANNEINIRHYVNNNIILITL